MLSKSVNALGIPLAYYSHHYMYDSDIQHLSTQAIDRCTVKDMDEIANMLSKDEHNRYIWHDENEGLQNSFMIVETVRQQLFMNDRQVKYLQGLLNSTSNMTIKIGDILEFSSEEMFIAPLRDARYNLDMATYSYAPYDLATSEWTVADVPLTATSVTEYIEDVLPKHLYRLLEKSISEDFIYPYISTHLNDAFYSDDLHLKIIL